MKKKLISSITSLALLFTSVFYGLSVPVHAEETGNNATTADMTDADMHDELIENREFIRDPETGHISMIETAVYSRRSAENPNGVSPNGLPSYYPSDSSTAISTIYSKYPATRDQNPYGTCWAHAATACAEFDIIKQHGHSKSINYSELQLAYFNYNTGSVLPGLEGDRTWIPANTNAKHYLDVGGNMVYSMNTLSQWKCYTGENILPYSKVTPTSNKYFNVEGYFKNTYANSHTATQLRNVQYLDIKNNPASVKQAIIDHGAVYISYYADSRYYNSSTNTYNNYNNISTPTTPNTNHDIVIVGWNDSKGAWLARNSWNVTSSGSGSQYTYFWLSYQDKSLAYTAYSLDFEPYSSSDHLYQHDGVAFDTGIYSSSAANVFKANSSMRLGYEKLDSIMVSFTSDTNINYKIDIYTGVTASNPTSGKLQSASTTTGWTTNKGIYTIDLKSPVYLSPGEKFSVVVTILGKSTYFRIERDWNVTYNQGGTTYSWFSTDAHADAGESFYIKNGRWTDTTNEFDSTYGNIRIKSITSDTSTKPYSITYNLNGGVNSSSNPATYLSTQTGTFTLKDPAKTGYHFLGWYDSNGIRVAQINYGSKKDITLTARWCADNGPERAEVSQPATRTSDGYYTSYCRGCGKLNGSYPIYAISSVKLASDKITYTGKTLSPVPVITDSHGNQLVNGSDFTCSYNKSSSNRIKTGRYYLTVKFKDKYSADPVKLYYTVVPKAPSSMSATLYGYDDIKVSWKKCTGASGYAVYYKKSTSSKYTLLKRTTSLYVKKKNLSDNVKYNFKVVPYYKYKSGSKYKYDGVNYRTASATTLKKLAQPKMKKDGSRVSLTWQSISGASGYQVYWSAKKKGTYKKLCDYSSKYVGMSFSVGKGKTYYYKTRAYKKVGKTKIYGPWSTPKAFKR